MALNTALLGPTVTEVWPTPDDLFRRIAAGFGPFVLDVAADAANTKVPGNWYGPDHPDPLRRDGLARCWAEDVAAPGPVWANPPYGRGIGRWLAAAALAADAGLQVVALLPASTDTRWFHQWCADRPHWFLRGRLRFGEAQYNAPFPSCVVLFEPSGCNGNGERRYICRRCGDWFTAGKSNAAYCSQRCRTAAHRAGR